MFTSLDLSLVRERNERLLREVDAQRPRTRLRANRDRETRPGGSRRTIAAFLPRGFASTLARSGRTGGEGVGPKSA